MLSVISEGLNFSSIERFLAKNNIKTCSKKVFHSTLKKIVSVLIEMSNKVCYKNFLSMGNNAILSFDSAWAHRRKSYQCFGAVIDTKSDKTVGWETIEEKCTSPQSLESEV